MTVGPRQGWVWTALPSGCGRVEVHSNPELARLLAAAGLDVELDATGTTPDAVIVAGQGRLSEDELRRLAAELPRGGVLAVEIDAEPENIDGWARLRSLRELIALSPALQGARVARTLRSTGLDVWRLDTGPRARMHTVSTTTRRLPAWPGRHPIVLAGKQPQATIEEAVLSEVESALGAPLRTRRRTVLESGMLMAEIENPAGERFLLRLAGGSAGALLSHSIAIHRSLGAAPAGPGVAARLVPTVASGTVGPIVYTVEPKLKGRHPRRLNARLLAECLDFLTALAAARAADSGDPGSVVAADCATVAPYLSDQMRPALERVSAALGERLAGVGTVWSHGDFWSGNLLVRRRRLFAVLDWDAATPTGLPLLDLLHLTALSDPAMRRLPHGRRCVEWLWPLSTRGGDERIRRYCERVGIPADPRTLEALAVAYWLSRVARDVAWLSDRTYGPSSMAVNLQEPLAALVARGW